MNVADVWRALIRHPVWLVLAVLLAVAAGGATFSVVRPVQQSTASVVIVPPVVPGDNIAGHNPLLNLDNTLAQLATVVGSGLQSDSTRVLLDAEGATGSFTIANVTSDNPAFAQLSPELQFTVTDASGTVAVRTAQALVTLAGTVLAQLQDQAMVTADARARTVTVAQPSSVSVAGNGQLRAAGGVGIIVLVLAAAVMVLLDAAATRRRRRRELAADTRRRRPDGAIRPARPEPADRADRADTGP